MKKNGFTLAEVLITLAIIGVVATMTLPALMTNTQEQQAKTGLKKGINTLTEAAATAQAITGADFSSVTAPGTVTTDPVANSLWELLSERLNVDLAKTSDTSAFTATGGEGGSGTQTIPTASVVATPQTIYLRDGSAIIIPGSDLPANHTTQAPDGLPVGYVVVYDTNGLKQPNILSNCQGTTVNTGTQDTVRTLTGDGVTSVEPIDTTSCTRAKRVIRDQFQLRLRGTTVEPEGEAAAWALNN